MKYSLGDRPPRANGSKENRGKAQKIRGELTGEELASATLEEFEARLKDCLQAPVRQIARLPADCGRAETVINLKPPLGLYSCLTYRGLVRDYNEDRITILSNRIRQENDKYLNINYFAIFDGHGGAGCSDFMQQNLHEILFDHPDFPEHPARALERTFQEAQLAFEKEALSKVPADMSGSCAIVVLTIDNMCYVANLGDCRAVLSLQEGENYVNLSKDHKPGEVQQQRRVLDAGGKIVQSAYLGPNGSLIKGPLRIYPGYLSLTRSFGDISAKHVDKGGNPLVLISEPEVSCFQITEDSEFILMGCDGMFDKIETKEMVETVWEGELCAPEQFCAEAVERLVRLAMEKESFDNLSVILIGFRKFKRLLEGGRSEE